MKYGVRLAAILVLCAATVCHSAAASVQDGLARQSGERLLEACRAALPVAEGTGADVSNVADANLCIGFVEGFVWGHGWEAWRAGEDMYFCPPQPFVYQQALKPLIEYLEAHPERLIQRAHLLLFSALSSAFPCVE